jgi:primosomal protein N' (replication factor Y)
MDRDTTTRKGSIIKLLKDLRNHNIDILVGTQMVAKGHDFPNITLVGIICADLSLSFPDFRAGERTFQLLAQVSGRAGRGDLPGRVILQTYNPDHFSIAAAKDQDFKNFYKNEIGFRKALNYPPFSRMIQFKISGTDKTKTGEHARAIGDLCFKLQRSNVSFSNFVEILGPLEAPLPRIAKKYRWQILLKGLRVHLLHQFVRRLLFENPAHFNHRFIKVAVDVDPFFMM